MTDFSEYYKAVEKVAVTFGYSEDQVSMFEVDIQDCFNKDKTVEECLEEVF